MENKCHSRSLSSECADYAIGFDVGVPTCPVNSHERGSLAHSKLGADEQEAPRRADGPCAHCWLFVVRTWISGCLAQMDAWDEATNQYRVSSAQTIANNHLTGA